MSCASCGLVGARAWCTGCDAVAYCDSNCQEAHWGKHAFICGKRDRDEEEEEEKKRILDEIDPEETITLVSGDGTEVIANKKNVLKNSVTLLNLYVFGGGGVETSLPVPNADTETLQMFATIVDHKPRPKVSIVQWARFWNLANYLDAERVLNGTIETVFENEKLLEPLKLYFFGYGDADMARVRNAWGIPANNMMNGIHFDHHDFPFEDLNVDEQEAGAITGIFELQKVVWMRYIFPKIEKVSKRALFRFALLHPRTFQLVSQYICPKLRNQFENMEIYVGGKQKTKALDISDAVLFSAYMNVAKRDPVTDLLSKSDAKDWFVLTDSDLAVLPHLNYLTVTIYAFAKHGGVAGIKLAAQKRKEKGDKLKAANAKRKEDAADLRRRQQENWLIVLQQNGYTIVPFFVAESIREQMYAMDVEDIVPENESVQRLLVLIESDIGESLQAGYRLEDIFNGCTRAKFKELVNKYL